MFVVLQGVLYLDDFTFDKVGGYSKWHTQPWPADPRA
jgi:hypothetical protein